jgi:hypothetical protein
MISNSGAQEVNALSYILSDPCKVCKQVSRIELGDETTFKIIEQQLGRDVCQFIDKVEDEYTRLVVDILGMLPTELSFRILFFLDHKSLAISMQICRKWYNLINNQVFWKCMSYINGWGLVFLPKEKSFDWKEFYQSMAFGSKIDFVAMKTAYFKELEGHEGLQ